MAQARSQGQGQSQARGAIPGGAEPAAQQLATTAPASGTDQNGPPSSVAPPSSSAPGAPVNPGGVSFPKGRPTFTSNDGRFSAAVGLQLHYDIGGEFQGSRPGRADNRQFTRLDSFGENLRRGRLPLVFSYDDFQVNITPDFGNSPDGSPSLYEANINWTPIKPLTVTAGYFKPWLTLQDSMSSNDFLFLERPSIVEASRNIAAGDARSSAGMRWAENRYFIAGYLTGSAYGSQGAVLAENGQTGATLRLAGRPVATADWDVHLGVSASQAFRLQRSVNGQTINIQDRPELRIDQNRLVSTGGINARSAGSYGPEFAVRWRNLML
jgi:phosphate-selective porin OprO/OprP